MKIEKNELKKALNKLGVCVDKSNKAAKVSFWIFEDHINFKATDGINGAVSLNINKDGQETDWKFLVDYKFLQNCCKLRGKSIEFKKNGNKLIASDENTVFQNGIEDSNVELFEFMEIKNSFKVKVCELQKVLRQGAFARNEKDSRKFITGAELSVFDGKLQVLSTDSKIMAKSVINIDDRDIEHKCLLSPKIIEAINNLDGEEVEIKVNDKVINFISFGCQYCMPVLDGSFPDTSKFFVEQECSQYIVNRNQILESFNLLSVVEDLGINIKCKEGKIELSSNDVRNNIKDIIVGQKKTGDDFQFNINRELFADVFKNLSKDKIVIKYKGQGQPIEYNDEEGSCGVIMPMRKS